MNAPAPLDDANAAKSKASAAHLDSARRALRICLGVAIANCAVWPSTLGAQGGWLKATFGLFTLLALVQLGAALRALAETKLAQRHFPRVGGGQFLLGVLGALSAALGWVFGSITTLVALLGGA